MKATDLRIGNYVIYKSIQMVRLNEKGKYENYEEPHQLHQIQISSNDFKFIEKSQLEYRPIPLTEEWFLKFGFKLHYGTYTIKTNRGTITIEEDLAEISNEFSNTGFNAPCKYVHQLQNIYHALTGEELTLKELK